MLLPGLGGQWRRQSGARHRKDATIANKVLTDASGLANVAGAACQPRTTSFERAP